MTSFFQNFKNYISGNVGVDNMASIKELSSGQFALMSRIGDTIGVYSRARDARRGAERRGITVA